MTEPIARHADLYDCRDCQCDAAVPPRDALPTLNELPFVAAPNARIVARLPRHASPAAAMAAALDAMAAQDERDQDTAWAHLAAGRADVPRVTFPDTDAPCIAGDHYPTDDGAACRYCGLPAEIVSPRELVAALRAAGAPIDPDPEPMTD